MPAVGRAVPMQWLHPNLRAAAPADFLAVSLYLFVSWSMAKSSADVEMTFVTADAHELALDVSIDHKPFSSHHRSSSVEDCGTKSF